MTCPEPSIFIGGSQRSGTTLLCQMLCAHPDIFISNEIPSVTEDRPSAHISKEKFDEYLKKGLKNHFGITLEEILKKEKKSIWGLKAPQLIYHIDNLVSFYPKCKILLMLRDGRAYANSVMKTKWGIANIYSAAQIWKQETLIIENVIRKFKENCVIVRYENLLLHTRDELDRICKFINIEFHDIMLEFYKAKTLFNVKESNKNVFKKINPDFIHKWQHELTSFQINVFESVCKDLLCRYNYPLVGKPMNISLPLKIFFHIHQRIIGELQLQKKRHIWKKELEKYDIK